LHQLKEMVILRRGPMLYLLVNRRDKNIKRWEMDWKKSYFC